MILGIFQGQLTSDHISSYYPSFLGFLQSNHPRVKTTFMILPYNHALNSCVACKDQSRPKDESILFPSNKHLIINNLTYLKFD